MLSHAVLPKFTLFSAPSFADKQAEADEKVRVDAVLEDQMKRGVFGKEKRPANRPDRY
jgi:hypothetical protein